MFMSTENEVTIISKYYFLSNLEICFKFLYQIEKKWLYFLLFIWLCLANLKCIKQSALIQACHNFSFIWNSV